MLPQHPDNAAPFQDWVLFGKVWTTKLYSEETDRVMKIIEDHVNFMKALYRGDLEDEDLRQKISQRDELGSMIKKAGAFREERRKEVNTIRKKILGMKVDVDPATGEEDPDQRRAKDKLETDLKTAIKESKTSNENVVRAEITNKEELKAFDKRFRNDTIHQQLNGKGGKGGLKQSVIDTTKKVRETISNDYFTNDSYFVELPPPESVSDSPNEPVAPVG